MHWFIDIAAGVFLALLFYALVRVRIFVAPRMRERYGDYARWATWCVTAGLMIALANLGLIQLRKILHSQYSIDAPIQDELVFSLVAFVVGFYLVFRHVARSRSD